MNAQCAFLGHGEKLENKTTKGHCEQRKIHYSKVDAEEGSDGEGKERLQRL